MTEIRFGRFENQSQQVLEDLANGLTQLGEAIQDGFVSSALLTELNLTGLPPVPWTVMG